MINECNDNINNVIIIINENNNINENYYVC